MHRLLPLIVAALAAQTRIKMPNGKYRRGLKVMISGIPGIGKTALLTELAHALNVQFWGLATSIYGPQDFNGIPIVVEGDTADSDGKTKITGKYLSFAPPKWAIEAHKAAAQSFSIVLMDEINTCSNSTQMAILKVLSEGQVGDLSLHENVLFIFAGNPPECGGRPLLPAVANRMIHLVAEPDDVDKLSWCDWLEGTSSAGSLSHVTILTHEEVDKQWSTTYAKHAADVADFHRKHVGVRMWCNMPPIGTAMDGVSGPHGAWASKRSWTELVSVLTTAEIHNLSVEDTDLLGVGTVGSSAYGAFRDWMGSRKDHIDPVEFFANDCEFDLTKEVDAVANVLKVCSSYALASDEDTKLAFWRFLDSVYDSDKRALGLAAVEAMRPTVQESKALKTIGRLVTKKYGEYIRKNDLDKPV